MFAFSERRPSPTRITPTLGVRDTVHRSAATRSNLAWQHLATSIRVSNPNDTAEREADSAANQVMRSPGPAVQRKCDQYSAEEDNKHEIQRKPETSNQAHGAGQLAPSTTPKTPTNDKPSTSEEIPQLPTTGAQPVPMQKPPAQGPAIKVTNGWANPAGKSDRTTVGIGELSSFVVSDVAGGSWKSADGQGTTINSVTFRWTASAVGDNIITYTAADKRASTITMKTVLPSKLVGKKDKDLSYPQGTQGAGMDLTVTVLPTTVSFQALELMEGTCPPSAISGYFKSHTPGSHDAAAGAGTWNQVGPNNDVSDTANAFGWPSPWSKGSYTWSIPSSWRTNGSKTSTRFSANNIQLVNITGSDGTTTVSKLGAKTNPRKP